MGRLTDAEFEWIVVSIGTVLSYGAGAIVLLGSIIGAGLFWSVGYREVPQQGLVPWFQRR